MRKCTFNSPLQTFDIRDDGQSGGGVGRGWQVLLNGNHTLLNRFWCKRALLAPSMEMKNRVINVYFKHNVLLTPHWKRNQRTTIKHSLYRRLTFVEFFLHAISKNVNLVGISPVCTLLPSHGDNGDPWLTQNTRKDEKVLGTITSSKLPHHFKWMSRFTGVRRLRIYMA